MRLLLDTHVLLWMIADNSRLPKSAREIIQDAEDLAWSTASLWEIGIKLSLARPDFRLRAGWERLFPKEMTRNGIHRVDLQPAQSLLERVHPDVTTGPAARPNRRRFSSSMRRRTAKPTRLTCSQVFARTGAV